MARRAFIVIVEYPDEDPMYRPTIGDIHWELLRGQFPSTWEIHTTELTAAMLAHHNLPDGKESNG